MIESSMKTLNPAMVRVLKRLHYPLDVILTFVRWYAAYPLSLRHLEEMMAERGVSVDHSTVHRCAIKLLKSRRRATLTLCQLSMANVSGHLVTTEFAL